MLRHQKITTDINSYIFFTGCWVTRLARRPRVHSFPKLFDVAGWFYLSLIRMLVVLACYCIYLSRYIWTTEICKKFQVGQYQAIVIILHMVNVFLSLFPLSKGTFLRILKLWNKGMSQNSESKSSELSFSSQLWGQSSHLTSRSKRMIFPPKTWFHL
jgi:hypothetical protein